jgi:spore germination cell wall hydrolase CwlJ-like protein
MSHAADLDTLKRTIWGEARGEPFDGMLAVAWVIVNRAKRRNMSIRDVCLQPWQFSCWNAADPNLPQMAKASPEDPGMLICEAAALVAMTRSQVDPTGGATNYVTLGLLKIGAPAWTNAPTMIPTARIGAHAFYRED